MLVFTWFTAHEDRKFQSVCDNREVCRLFSLYVSFSTSQLSLSLQRVTVHHFHPNVLSARIHVVFSSLKIITISQQ